MPTALAFRTPLGGVSIPGSVDVHDFSKIRFVADERVGSATGINIQLSGGGFGAQLDTLSLAPHLQVTWVNDVRQGS